MVKATVLVVDRSAIFRRGVAAVLAEGDFEVAGEAEDLRAALGLVKDGLRAQILLFDFTEGGSEAEFEALQRLYDFPNQMKLVALTALADPASTRRLFHMGGVGVLDKNRSPASLLHALGLVRLGEAVFPHGVMQEGREEDRAGQDAPAHRAGLTATETEVLRLIKDGQENKEIARAMGISETTVKVHLRSIYPKIGAKNRVDAAVWYVKNLADGAGSPPANHG